MFADNLKYFRKRERLTQKELADKLGVSRSAIAMYEKSSREPDFETLENIADFFNVNMSTLLGEKEKEPIPKDELISEVIELFSQLRSDEQGKVLAYAQGLLANRGE